MKRKIRKRVIVGGTFDIFHRGHQALLKKAYQLGEVEIGLTSDQMAKRTKKRKVKPFRERKRIIQEFIKKFFKKEAKIFKINDRFGPTLKEDFDYLVVSPETLSTAFLINRKRKLLNKKPIKIVKIPFVLAKDGKPISSTRILQGEIDENGNLLKKAEDFAKILIDNGEKEDC